MESNAKYMEYEKQNSFEIFQATKQPEHMLISVTNFFSVIYGKI